MIHKGIKKGLDNFFYIFYLFSLIENSCNRYNDVYQLTDRHPDRQIDRRVNGEVSLSQQCSSFDQEKHVVRRLKIPFKF